MIWRRLYSSLHPRAGASSLAETSAPASKAATRGRTRPVRLRAQLSPRKDKTAAAPVATAAPTRGRRVRRASLVSAADLISSSAAPSTAYSFRPVVLYPFQAGLHLSFTPPHMPLPVHIGTKGYLSPENNPAGSGPLFERPAKPSPAEALPKDAPVSALAEHLGVSRAFSHPALVEHLGAPALGTMTSMRALDLDADLLLSQRLEAAATANSDAANSVWDAALARLGAAAAPPSPASVNATAAAERASIDDALAGLDGLLARLEARPSTEAAAEDIVVELDSVKRKRKKKISKHKYKKRRKATRSQRKRLGK